MKRLTEGALALGATTLGLIALLAVAHSTVLILGGVVHPATTMVAVAGAFAGLWFLLIGWAPGQRVAMLAAMAGILVLAVVLSAATTDTTWDGNTYHKASVFALGHGWNPVWESIADFNQSPRNPLVVPEPYPLWNDSYPKATWIFGASVYQLAGTIEAGKALNPLLMFAVFLVGAGYLGQRIGVLRGTVLAGGLAWSPVAVAQASSYYVDGALGSLLVVLMLLLTMLLDGWEPPHGWHTAYWPTVAAVLIVLVNVKFTGLLYAGIAGVVYLAALLLPPRRDREQALALSVTGAVGAVVGVGLVGASSYVRNLITQGNPLYPLVGPDRVDILTSNQPTDFAQLDRFSRFVVANLSRTANLGLESAPLKVPFSVSVDELRLFRFADVRLAGYGVWFGGILLVTLAIGIWLVARHGRAGREFLPAFLCPLVVTLIGVLAVDGSWWARYTPHLWAFPFLVMAALWITRARFLPWVLALALTANTTGIAWQQVGSQMELWRRPTLAERVDSAGGCALYAGIPPEEPFTGALYNFVDAVPRLRVLTDEEFERYRADAFVEMNLSDDWPANVVLMLTEDC